MVFEHILTATVCALFCETTEGLSHALLETLAPVQLESTDARLHTYRQSLC
jgi:hypothetical protein